MSEQLGFPGYHAANLDRTVGPPQCVPAAIKLLNSARAGCNVIGMSEVGATISVSDDQALPVLFELYIGPAGIMQQCRLIHRADGIVVVEFVQCPIGHESRTSSGPGGMQTDKRAHVRIEVNWPAICCLPSGFSWSSSVTDVSFGGMRIHNCPPLSVDDRVVVSLADIGTFSCRVAWSNGTQCGMEFLLADGELDEDSLNELAASLRSLPASVCDPSTR